MCIYILHSVNEKSIQFEANLFILVMVSEQEQQTTMAGSQKASGSENKTIDPSHPLYIHHSDQPGHVLVPIKLNGVNYQSWSKAVIHALTTKKKIGFVDGTVEEPSQEDEPFMFEQWNQCNNMILSWLTHAVESDIAEGIIHAKTAREVWVDLRDQFSQKNAPAVFQIQKSIATMSQGTMTVAAYFTKIKALWDELETYRSPLTYNQRQAHLEQREEDRLMQFLMGLNESYKAVRSNILMMSPLPNVRQAYSLIVQEEMQRQVSSEPTKNFSITAAVPGKGGNPRQKMCDHCNRSGHTIDECRTLKFHCKFCDKRGHTEDRCRLKNGSNNKTGQFRGQRPFGRGNQPSANATESQEMSDSTSSSTVQGFTTEQIQQLAQAIRALNHSNSGNIDAYANAAGLIPSTLMSVNSSSTSSWILDTGATDHIVSHMSLFTDLKPSNVTTVNLPNGAASPITHTGTVIFYSQLTLKDVLCVPSFNLNLISASKLAKDQNCCIIFFPDYCILQDLVSGKMIGSGKQRGGLYYMHPSTNKSVVFHVSQPFDLWHLRLGHPSFSRFKLLSHLLPDIHKELGNHCPICPQAKQTRLPFPKSSITTKFPFSLLHCDVWGPHKIPAHTGSRYFLTIVDDFSRCTWIFLMHHKSETQSLLTNFVQFVKTQFHTDVQTVRMDNGTEFIPLRIFLQNKGIELQTSCIYTPQQNGVVERKHRHILNVARSLMFQSNVPLEFWGECVLTAVYLINRIPTPLLSNKSPFEVLYNRPPSLTHLRVFGCECYVTNVHPKQKFDPRASICVFLGYPHGKKGYKVLDLQTQKISVSRDIFFRENIFPFHSSSSQSQQHSPSLPLPLPISFDSTPQPISLPRFSPSSTPPLSHHNPVSSPPSSNTDVPEPLSPESVASPLPSSPSPSSLSSPPSVPSVPSNTSAPSPTHEPPLRRSTRHIQPPAWHHDYAMSAQLNHSSTQSSSRQGTRYPLSSHLSFFRFSPHHRAFLALLTAQTEPSSFEQADCDPRWRQAMSTELQALERNNTWEMVPLPPGHKPIGCRWVYKIKYHSDGTIERYKARLVAKGYTQVAGIDYQETFSPTAKLTTLRCLLTVAASRNWYIHQLDVHNAFLHGNLQEEVYMTPPPGLRRQGENLVCRLRKSIYGLKQASRNWFSTFTATVKSAGYIQSKADYSLFTKSQGNKFTAILIYVDDILLTGNDLHEIKMLKTHLLKRFFIKDLGELKYFLGIEFSRSKKGIFMSQRKYALDILQDIGLTRVKPEKFPMEQNLKLTDEDGELLHDPSRYRRLVGRLIYLTVTRPDIVYPVRTLSQFMNTPRKPHWEAALRVLRYIKGSPGQGLFLPSENNLTLSAFCDSDWGGCRMSRRSVSGYCVFLGSSLISWK